MTSTNNGDVPKTVSQCKKKKIPIKVKHELWKSYYGEVWWGKCTVSWCTTKYPVLSSEWHAGHNIPESRGGSTTMDNLRPICASCNLGMGSEMTVDEWDKKYGIVSNQIRYVENVLFPVTSGKRKREEFTG